MGHGSVWVIRWNNQETRDAQVLGGLETHSKRTSPRQILRVVLFEKAIGTMKLIFDASRLYR